MPQTATLPGGGSGGGLESLPGVVKIGLIGGGLGLAFFLWKRASGGSTAASSGGQLDSSTYGIPNTAVMLGSLQQEMLDLKGQQGADTANLTDLLTGGFSNIGSLFDAQTGQIQSGLTDVQNAVIANQNANTQSILASLAARSDLLTQLINTNSGAEQAAFSAFQDATSKGLGSIAAQQNAEMAAIGALGNNISTQQADIISRIRTMQDTTNSISAGMNSANSNISALGSFLGWQWYQIPNRYTAYLPGEAGSGYGGSVLGGAFGGTGTPAQATQAKNTATTYPPNTMVPQ